ncbi:leucyl aminopeptidase [Corynebacterium guangdongense]|uniref:Probable cytosol aminopeptidase n=1 Tax=Corynebacterium guangdongense TaxID=1783348 RepID=A0ABU1ZXW3_9CORY|nr:leucyl aminopeptidase [Corynebacterium guangdongense]MDR7329777.1 leucyl aminopeptidase [Corynebacterium guangdongense]WJZ18340.1 Cytosol aminopeptidase [Corynebacterium guangdongense]
MAKSSSKDAVADTDAVALPAHGTYPEVKLAKKAPKKADAYVVHLFSGEESPELPTTRLLDDVALRATYEALTAVGATGKAEEITRIPAPAEVDVDVIVAVGLGDPEELTDETVRRASGCLARSLASSKLRTVAVTPALDSVQALVEGLMLGGYAYKGIRSAQESAKDEDGTGAAKDGKVTEQVYTVVVDEDRDGDAAETAVDTGRITAEAVITARDLVNTPASHLYPENYAELLAALGEEAGLEVEVLDEKALRKQGFGGVLAVGQGSARPPRVVRLSYTPAKGAKKAPQIALVGKGITFDTGGISLKPPASMENMISDMGGSAAMAAAVIAAARLGLGVNVTATVALAENMPSGTATRPGDVITHYGGITSEIINTDAEGRLVLADAIARASEDKPQYLVEASTLTGAQLVALGVRTAAVMGTEEFRDRVAATGRAVGENAWSMPLLEEHDKEIKSMVADIRNSHNSRHGGMVFAGTYLEKFVGEDIEWAHIDIAGPSWNDGGPRGYTPKRATGQPVRTILALLADLAGERT